MNIFSISESEDYNKPIFVTNRELECIQLLIKGQPAKQIARNLNISYRTVEAHFYNIKQKTGCKNRYDIIRVFLACNIHTKNSE